MVRNADSSAAGVATASAAANANDGTYSIKVNQLATSVSKASTAELAGGISASGSSLTLFEQFSEFAARGHLATDNISVTINGQTLEFDLDVDNMTTVASKINQAGLGVAASYDSKLNRFFINTTTTGSDAKISIAADTAGFFANLGVDDSTSMLKLNVNQAVDYTGQNASIDFGDATGLVSSANAITVNGITINLKGQGSSTITVTRNIEGVIDSINKFVDSYNTTLKTLYDKLQEERDPEFPPLTDAQKDEMSDSQIEDWEKKAKSGLLRNDERLKSIINSFRSASSTSVNGIDRAYNALSAIGIKSESYDKSGQLVVDEDVLREALTKDPDAVKELFTTSSTVDSQQGIAAKLYQKTLSGISYLADKAGSSTSTGTVDSSILGKKISKLTDELKTGKKS